MSTQNVSIYMTRIMYTSSEMASGSEQALVHHKLINKTKQKEKKRMEEIKETQEQPTQRCILPSPKSSIP